MIIAYEERTIRKSVKRFLEQVHDITPKNTPKKSYKKLVNEGVNKFKQYIRKDIK